MPTRSRSPAGVRGRFVLALEQQLKFLASREQAVNEARLQSLVQMQQRLHRLLEQMGLARRRGLLLAEARLGQAVPVVLRELQHLLGQIQAAPVPPIQLSTADLLAELQQLEEEFECVEVTARSLWVQTEAITLEEVELGPFRIHLALDRLRACPGSLRIEALEPNPPAADQAVTHPHVKHEELCAGEAVVPISLALRSGRLADAMCLVRSVLSTYNSSSPHVALEEWQGLLCADCDRRVHHDDLCTCRACGHEYCSDCIGSCDVCDDSCCSSCLDTDDTTGTVCCPDCREVCSICHRTVHSEHFDEEHQCCPACLDSLNKENDDHDDLDEPQCPHQGAQAPAEPLSPSEPFSPVPVVPAASLVHAQGT
jgi:hypothetical protein